MWIKKIFSNVEDTERFYSVLMNEKELVFFSDYNKQKYNDDTIPNVAIATGGLGLASGLGLGYHGKKIENKITNKIANHIPENSIKETLGKDFFIKNPSKEQIKKATIDAIKKRKFKLNESSLLSPNQNKFLRVAQKGLKNSKNLKKGGMGLAITGGSLLAGGLYKKYNN